MPASDAMPAPKITVLLTVFNGMPYLRETVASVLAQDMREFVFLILNNGSVDGTRAFLEEAAERKDARLRILHLPENIGRTAALNKGLFLVETPFTAIIDADDLAAPSRLSEQCAFLEAHPEVVLAGSDILTIDRNGAVTGQLRFPEDHETLRDRFPLYNQFAHAACCFRTLAAREAGGYPDSLPYAQDFGLWIAMMRRGGRIASIPRPLASIRVHPGQATRDLRLMMVRNKDNLLLSQSMLEIPDLAPSSRQAALLRAAYALLRMGRRASALRALWRAAREAPLLLPVNPLLWRRALHDAVKILSRLREKLPFR